MGWEQTAIELFEQGWRLQLNQLDCKEWKAFYGNATQLPQSAKADNPVEAIEKAQLKISAVKKRVL